MNVIFAVDWVQKMDNILLACLVKYRQTFLQELLLTQMEPFLSDILKDIAQKVKSFFWDPFVDVCLRYSPPIENV